MKSLFLLLIFLPVISFSQQTFIDSITVDSETGNVKYEIIADQPGTKDQLYSKAKLWIADNFKSAKSVIQTDDKTEGIIVCKGYSRYRYTRYYVTEKTWIKRESISNYPEYGETHFTLKFFLKDNKYKAVITDIELEEKLVTIVVSNYIWAKSNLATIKNADDNTMEIKALEMRSLSKQRAIHDIMVSAIEGIRSYMAKRAENDF